MSILVLEDTPNRVQWLRLNTKCDITHVSNVTDFKAALAEAKEPFKCVILDHDLGNFGPDATEYARGIPEGPDGLTGFDAAQAIPDEYGANMVIIWSWNPEGADRMHADLADRNISSIIAAFGDKLLGTLIDIAVR